MKVDIVTPTGPAFSGDAEEIVAPGALGELGVLPGHIPLLTGLRAGVLRLRQLDGSQRAFAVGAGFLQVGVADRVVVLAEFCEAPADVDAKEAQGELSDAQARLGKWEGEVGSAEWQHVEARRAWAQARLTVLSEKTPEA